MWTALETKLATQYSTTFKADVYLNPPGTNAELSTLLGLAAKADLAARNAAVDGLDSAGKAKYLRTDAASKVVAQQTLSQITTSAGNKATTRTQKQ